MKGAVVTAALAVVMFMTALPAEAALPGSSGASAPAAVHAQAVTLAARTTTAAKKPVPHYFRLFILSTTKRAEAGSLVRFTVHLTVNRQPVRRALVRLLLR